MNRRMQRLVVWTTVSLCIATVAAGCGDSGPGASAGARATPTVVAGAGNISPTVERYRGLLGADNGNGPTRHVTGRREINWDAVPDAFAAPNALPPDFFNAPDAPRARGARLDTPGDHVAVSADGDNPSGAPVRFSDINPTYSDAFRTFSAERLFSPVGSNVVDLRFAVPGTHTPAAVRGFGAVYTDVDRKQTAEFELFDAHDALLGAFAVPVSKDGLSFLGIAFPDAVVARVHIVYGNTKLGPNDDAHDDVAVMDDFIYGEPQPIRS
jgi:hypothetical protein